jgi:hypothetical protein
MQFSNLPLINTDNSELLAYQSTTGAVGRVSNDYQAILDGVITNLVLVNQTSSSTLASHISNSTLHVPISDTSTTGVSTWSSSKIANAIAGSDIWFNLDSVPEGDTNLYYTEARGRQLATDLGLGINTVDHQAIATQLASVLLGFNSTVFRYELDPQVTDREVSITVDGVTTTAYFDVTPGVHQVLCQSSNDWVCQALAHKVRINSSSTATTLAVTPTLSLDAFTDGTTNKFWSEATLGDSNYLASVANHLGAGFNDAHVPIEDNQFAATDSTWSSSKIQTEVIGAIASNATFTATKEIAIAHEMANSGSRPSGNYNWVTDPAGSQFTHYVKRRCQTQTYRNQVTISSDSFQLRTGRWLVYWVSNTTLNPYFTNTSNVATYLANSSTPKVPLLAYPSVVTVTATSQTFCLVTRFTADQTYSSTYRNTWLMPMSIPGLQELYSVLHIERIS